jgi:hypothetical protein
LEYNGEDSYTRRKSATHLGSYGPKVTKELVAAGISPQRIVDIGSPRFDVYTAARKTRVTSAHNGFSILCLYPDLSYGDGFDEYDVDGYVKAFVDAVRTVPGAQIIFKLRGSRREAFARRRIAYHCKGIMHTIVRDEPLAALFVSCDMAVSPYSTAVLEAVQSGIPVVVFALLEVEQRFCSAHFKVSDGISVSYTTAELSKTLQLLSSKENRSAAVSKADAWTRESYFFDGKAASRAADLVMRLSHETPPGYSKTANI